MKENCHLYSSFSKCNTWLAVSCVILWLHCQSFAVSLLFNALAQLLRILHLVHVNAVLLNSSPSIVNRAETRCIYMTLLSEILMSHLPAYVVWTIYVSMKANITSRCRSSVIFQLVLATWWCVWLQSTVDTLRESWYVNSVCQNFLYTEWAKKPTPYN